MSDLSSSIRMARKALEITQSELAARLGILPAQLSRIETGHTDPSVGLAARIAEAMGLSLSELLADHVSQEAAPATAEVSAVGTGEKVKLVPVRVVPISVERRVRKAIVAGEKAFDAFAASRRILPQTMLQLAYPFLGERGAAETLARVLRAALGAGEVTFADLPGLLDLQGVRIHFVTIRGGESSLAFLDRTRGILSIAIEKGDTPERQTYRLAYELGAACLCASGHAATVRDEGTNHQFLRAFVAAFLMPEDAVRKVVAQCGLTRTNWTMASLRMLKVRFNVSAEAFALRLEGLGLITPSLRTRFRDELRAYYAAHPEAMEPEPNLPPLRDSVRLLVQEKRDKKTEKVEDV